MISKMMERERNGKRSMRDSLEEVVTGGETNWGIGSGAAGCTGAAGGGTGEATGAGEARNDWMSCWSWASVNTLRLLAGGGGVSEVPDIGEERVKLGWVPDAGQQLEEDRCFQETAASVATYARNG